MDSLRKVKIEIEKLEKASLNTWSTRIGKQPSQFIQEVIDHINKEFLVFGENNLNLLDDVGLKMKLETETDYWDFVHQSYIIARNNAIEMLCNYAKNDSVVFDTTSIKKCRRHSASPKERINLLQLNF